MNLEPSSDPSSSQSSSVEQLSLQDLPDLVLFRIIYFYWKNFKDLNDLRCRKYLINHQKHRQIVWLNSYERFSKSNDHLFTVSKRMDWIVKQFYKTNYIIVNRETTTLFTMAKSISHVLKKYPNLSELDTSCVRKFGILEGVDCSSIRRLDIDRNSRKLGQLLKLCINLKCITIRVPSKSVDWSVLPRSIKSLKLFNATYTAYQAIISQLVNQLDYLYINSVRVLNSYLTSPTTPLLSLILPSFYRFKYFALLLDEYTFILDLRKYSSQLPSLELDYTPIGSNSLLDKTIEIYGNTIKSIEFLDIPSYIRNDHSKTYFIQLMSLFQSLTDLTFKMEYINCLSAFNTSPSIENIHVSFKNSKIDSKDITRLMQTFRNVISIDITCVVSLSSRRLREILEFWISLMNNSKLKIFKYRLSSKEKYEKLLALSHLFACFNFSFDSYKKMNYVKIELKES